MSWFGKVWGAVVGRAAKTPPRRRGGRSVLLAIALMLGLSGVLRLGNEAGSAFASGSEAIEPDASASEATCTTPDDIAAVLVLLDERETRVATRESDLADRVQALAVAETQIQRNMAALEEAETRLAATMARASTAAEEDLERLTAVYENMKPKQAAPVFAAMDPQFAAGFLGRMRPDVAAAILAGLEPEAAYAISALLAGRNANAPTE
mgnify:CR=1 FL=1